MREQSDSILSDQRFERFPPAIVSALSRAMPLIPRAMHERVLTIADEILALSSPAASEFLRSCPFVTGRAGPAGLESWCQEGLDVLRKSEQSGIAYFRLGMSKSALLLQELSSGVELGSIKWLLEAYCLALTGRETPILSTDPPQQPASAEVPGDSRAVFLPDFVDRYPTKPRNFTWYKVMATHQAGHVEFGSYDLRFDTAVGPPHDLSPEPDGRVRAGNGQTDLAGFLNLFDDRRLATDIFTIVEDGRIDSLVKGQYRGIAGAYSEIQSEALSARPPLTSYRLKEAFLEALVRMSLGRLGQWSVPAELRTPLYQAALVMKRVLTPDAAVEDSAEATVQLYGIVSRLANDPVPPDRWETIDLDGCPAPSSDDVDDVLKEPLSGDTDPTPYVSPAEVAFRGVHRLELDRGPAESQWTHQGETETGSPSPPRQTSEEAADTDDLPDVGVLAVAAEDPEEESYVFGANTANREDVQVLTHPEQGGDDDSSERALEVDGPSSYIYNEWDFRANDYRLRWCRVRQMPLQEGTSDFFEATLNEYSELAARIRQQFELLNLRFPRKAKRLQDGEDFDLDAVVDFVITRKARQSPDAKVYWRRNKTERDVSVAFLLDMSSSTIEYIDRTQRGGSPSQPLFRDYRDYFEWLQSDHDSLIRPKDFKRIIDLEKESLVLLTRALETIGDTYAIYGFSGYGRENVEFYVIKDLEEDLSDRVKSRIDNVAPQHGTRMGPAIRHATWKLEKQESRSKFLFLISDGRPEDHGYGRDGLEREYAINDTKMALIEARRKSITPFCLTIDQAGHDYLKTICGDMGYEVVADIESLPRCLPTLYGRFTT